MDFLELFEDKEFLCIECGCVFTCESWDSCPRCQSDKVIELEDLFNQ